MIGAEELLAMVGWLLGPAEVCTWAKGLEGAEVAVGAPKVLLAWTCAKGLVAAGVAAGAPKPLGGWTWAKGLLGAGAAAEVEVVAPEPLLAWTWAKGLVGAGVGAAAEVEAAAGAVAGAPEPVVAAGTLLRSMVFEYDWAGGALVKGSVCCCCCG